MQFFDELGNKISKEKFISIYSKSYFINEKRLVKGVSQNSSYAESEIEKILKNGIKTELDIVHILAWKIGKINHKKAQINLYMQMIGLMQINSTLNDTERNSSYLYSLNIL